MIEDTPDNNDEIPRVSRSEFAEVLSSLIVKDRGNGSISLSLPKDSDPAPEAQPKVDFYQSALDDDSGIKPNKVTITIDCTQDGVCPFWQAEIGGQLDYIAKLMITDRRIPRYIRDDDRNVIGSIIIE